MTQPELLSCAKCEYYRGRCVKGRKGKVANDAACDDFQRKSGKFEPFEPAFLRHPT